MSRVFTGSVYANRELKQPRRRRQQKLNDLLNDFLIIAKWHIWMSRKRSLTPDIAAFKEVINMKYKTEKYIAVKKQYAKEISGQMESIYW